MAGHIGVLEPQPLAGLEAVENYLSQHRQPYIPWHTILNNHSSTRPDARGGKTCHSITQCKTFVQTRWGGSWICRLDVPNSFAPGDGLRILVVIEAPTQAEAGQLVCRRAFAHLLVQNPARVVLRDKHWAISPARLVDGLPGVAPEHQPLPVRLPVRAEEARAEAAGLAEEEVQEAQLVEGLPGVLPQHQALPVHLPVRAGEAGAEAAGLAEEERQEAVADVLRTCLQTHGGEFDPSAISHQRAGLDVDHMPLYAQLQGLLRPGQLRAFVEKHPDFTWRPKNPGLSRPGMIITWSTSSGLSADGLDLLGRAASGPANAWMDQAGHDTKRPACGGGTSLEGAVSGSSNVSVTDVGRAASGPANVWLDEACRDKKRSASGGGASSGGPVPPQHLDGMTRVSPEHQVLSVLVGDRMREARAHAGGAPWKVNATLIADILRRWLREHGGEIDPYVLTHTPTEGAAKSTRDLMPDDESFLPRLVSVVERHSDLAWRPKNPAQDPPGIIITWATASGSANASAIDLGGGGGVRLCQHMVACFS